MIFKSFTKSNHRYAPALLALLGINIAGNAIAQSPATQSNKNQTVTAKDRTMSQAELEARGKALRQAVDAKYKELEAPGGAFSNPPNVKVDGLREANVTDIVLQYISIGMPLNEIEIILKAGGFNVSPLGSRDPNNGILQNKNNGVFGGLKLVADMHWFTSVGILIESSSSEGQYAAKIDAGFLKQVH
jgi:hypothetical protein